MTGQRDRRRPTRDETRNRILDGAQQAFAERGFGAASQDDICTRVGLTRGAFNSSFASKDELFLALYDRMIDRVRMRIEASLDVAADVHALDTQRFTDKFVANYPIDREWHVLNVEFTLYAIRNPTAAAHFASRRAILLDAICEGVTRLLDRQGREVAGPPRKLARLLLAIHDGNLSQSFVEPDALYPGEFFMLFGPGIIATNSRDRTAGTITDAANDG